MDEESKELIRELTIAQRRVMRLSGVFWRGVFYGLGFFVGSALLAAVLILILTHISVDGNTFFGKLIQFIVNAISHAKG
jgi:hypothetical protein